MRTCLSLLFLLLAVFADSFFAEKVFADKILYLKDSQTAYTLDSSYFERIHWAKESTLDSALVIPNTSVFPDNPEVKKSHWFRIKITNQSHFSSEEWILVCYYYQVDEFDMLVEDKFGQMTKQIFRDTMSVFSRAIQHKQPSFQISLAPNETKTIYLRIKNDSRSSYPMGLFSQLHFISKFFHEYLLMGLFYGFLLFVLVYSLINFLFFREKIVLIYLLFISSQVVFMLFRDGTGLFLLSDYWEYAGLIKNFSGAAISVFILLYAVFFLKIPKSSLIYTFVLFFIFARICLAVYMMKSTTTVTVHFDLLAILLSTGLSIKAFINKEADTKYMVIGLTMLSTTSFVAYLSETWIGTMGALGFFILYFGVAAESIFTTLALTERFKRIKLENFKKEQLFHELENKVQERTELITLQNKLLEEQTDELNSFLYRASHDLTGPIKSIEGLLNLALLDPKVDPKEFNEMMRSQLSKLDRNVADLNAVSILRKNEGVLREIEMDTLHEEALKHYEALIGLNNVSVFFNSTLESTFKNNYLTLKTIYFHLFGNALKFSDSTKEAFLKITVSKVNHQICMVFEDNGIGIDMAAMPFLYNMFFKRNDSVRADTGIGLYIVALAVKKLNGEIKTESEGGNGSTFTITFPDRAN